MIESGVGPLLFIFANFAISSAYIFLALMVLRRFKVRLHITRIGAVGFFLFCALTHIGMGYDLIVNVNMTIGEMYTSWLMSAIHVPQAICVWLFVIGLYIEVTNWGVTGGS